MPKYHGRIGYIRTVESPPGSGIWIEDGVYEVPHRGDVLQDARRWQPSDQIHDDLEMIATISIIAPRVTMDDIWAMRYVIYHGVKWKIQKIATQRPRLILTLGGKYNDEGDTPFDPEGCPRLE